jgi:hypothetical protein
MYISNILHRVSETAAVTKNFTAKDYQLNYGDLTVFNSNFYGFLMRCDWHPRYGDWWTKTHEFAHKIT